VSVGGSSSRRGQGAASDCDGVQPCQGLTLPPGRLAGGLCSERRGEDAPALRECGPEAGAGCVDRLAAVAGRSAGFGNVDATLAHASCELRERPADASLLARAARGLACGGSGASRCGDPGRRGHCRRPCGRHARRRRGGARRAARGASAGRERHTGEGGRTRATARARDSSIDASAGRPPCGYFFFLIGPYFLCAWRTQAGRLPLAFFLQAFRALASFCLRVSAFLLAQPVTLTAVL
jgi:hypothetical protein